MEISTDKSSGSINVVYSFSEKEVNLYSKVTENINKEASCILLEKMKKMRSYLILYNLFFIPQFHVMKYVNL